MIQDIHPHVFSNPYVITNGIEDSAYIFHFKGQSLLLRNEDKGFTIPQKKDITLSSTEGIYLFALNHVKCYLIWEAPSTPDNTFIYQDITSSYTIHQAELDWCTMVALQLKNWYEQNKYCGSCGTATEHKADERALVCPSCQAIKFPAISPAIIVAIQCEGQILLARGANFKAGYFSLVAGYVDIGESIEEAVHREVQEEVGIKIKNLRYYKSQPWPYSGSMMIGFLAEAEGKQAIKIDNVEIVEAGWFTKDDLPDYPPMRSIGGEIIEKFRCGQLW